MHVSEQRLCLKDRHSYSSPGLFLSLLRVAEVLSIKKKLRLMKFQKELLELKCQERFQNL